MLTKVIALVIQRSTNIPRSGNAFYRIVITEKDVPSPPTYEFAKELFRVRISDDWKQGAGTNIAWAEEQLESLVRVFSARGDVNDVPLCITVRVEDQTVEMTRSVAR